MFECYYKILIFRNYLTKWGQLINFEDSSFSVINFLSTAEKQLKWEADGLSSDQSAIKNAVFIDHVSEHLKLLLILGLTLDMLGGFSKYTCHIQASMQGFVSYNNTFVGSKVYIKI